MEVTLTTHHLFIGLGAILIAAQISLIVAYANTVRTYFIKRYKIKAANKLAIMEQQNKAIALHDEIKLEEKKIEAEEARLEREAEAKEKEEKVQHKLASIEALPKEWRTFYNNVKNVKLWHAQMELFRFFSENPMNTYITGEQEYLILSLLYVESETWSDEYEEERIKEASKLLAPFVRAESKVSCPNGCPDSIEKSYFSSPAGKLWEKDMKKSGQHKQLQQIKNIIKKGVLK